jgi:hypothetical protein
MFKGRQFGKAPVRLSITHIVVGLLPCMNLP